jgi:hypothetical protein
VLLSGALACAACASAPTLPDAVVPWGGDVGSAVAAVAGAAPGCGLKLVDGRRAEDGREALLVLLDGWQSPQPESAVVTVRVRSGAGAVAVELAARPLAEYGMAPPDIRAGSEAFGCVPCEALRVETPMVRYSRGLALGNATRAARCVREALEAGKNGAGGGAAK